MKALTPREARFVGEYLADPELNATRAYERAGYRARGASARVGACRLLTKANVAAAIARAQKERARRVQVTQDEVIEGLRREARGEGPDTTASARVTAWDRLGRHLGMFVDRVQHEGEAKRPVMVADRLDEATRKEIAGLEKRVRAQEDAGLGATPPVAGAAGDDERDRRRWAH